MSSNIVSLRCFEIFYYDTNRKYFRNSTVSLIFTANCSVDFATSSLMDFTYCTFIFYLCTSFFFLFRLIITFTSVIIF